MKNLPGMDQIKDAFRAAADKQQDTPERLARVVAAGGRAFLDKAREEFPEADLRTFLETLYKALREPSFADGVSKVITSFDAARTEEILQSFVDSLQDEKTALLVARQAKILLTLTTLDDIETRMERALVRASDDTKQNVRTLFWVLRPALDDIRDGTDAMGVARLQELAAMVPLADVAKSVGDITEHFTPDMVAGQIGQLLDALPPPAYTAHAVHAIAGIGSQHLGDIADQKVPLRDGVQALVTDLKKAKDAAAHMLKPPGN